MNIPGASALHHDSSAWPLVDGDIAAFAEEERCNRQKHTSAYPFGAMERELSAGRVRLERLDEVAFYLSPWNCLETGVEGASANFPKALGAAAMATVDREPD